jgi:hypothetical protein
LFCVTYGSGITNAAGAWINNGSISNNSRFAG